LIAKKSGIPVDAQQLITGYPPKVLEPLNTVALSKLGLSNGDVITLKKKEIPKDKEILIEETEKVIPPIAEILPPIDKQQRQSNIAITEPPPIDSDCHAVRRVVKADNNCLFNSIGYLFEGYSREKSSQLRKVVADFIAAHKEIYNELLLDGKTNEQYIQWISNSSHWGGAIEISIFTEYYQSEIAVLDTQSLRVDLFGQGNHYKQRVFLIYDGIHYDPIALTFDPSVPEDMDITVFSPNDGLILSKAKAIAQEANKRRAFTDLANFDLRCLVCQQGIKGEEGARDHAVQTGHTNFAEFK